MIRHISLNLLTQEASAKGGARAKQLKAGWGDQYLLKVLAYANSPLVLYKETCVFAPPLHLT